MGRPGTSSPDWLPVAAHVPLPGPGDAGLLLPVVLAALLGDPATAPPALPASKSRGDCSSLHSKHAHLYAHRCAPRRLQNWSLTTLSLLAIKTMVLLAPICCCNVARVYGFWH
jgi:hypothetical protein